MFQAGGFQFLSRLVSGVHTPQQELVDAAGNPAIGTKYEAVAPNTADAILGGAGAAGDLLSHIVVTPTSLSPGSISIEDGPAGASIVLFEGGANSLTTLHPFTINVGAVALAGGWRLTTGANIRALAVGNFS